MPKSKALTKAKPAREPPVMVIRRNAAPRPAIPQRAPAAKKPSTRASRKSMSRRVQSMGGSHVAVGVGAGTLGNIAGVIVAGRGWLSPKATAAVLTGTGAATATAGYFMDADHIMVAGAGITAAGVFSLANQYAVDGYEAMEKRAEEKQAERLAAEKRKELGEGKQAQAENRDRKPEELRNARRLIVIDRDGSEHEYEYAG